MCSCWVRWPPGPMWPPARGSVYRHYILCSTACMHHIVCHGQCVRVPQCVRACAAVCRSLRVSAGFKLPTVLVCSTFVHRSFGRTHTHRVTHWHWHPLRTAALRRVSAVSARMSRTSAGWQHTPLPLPPPPLPPPLPPPRHHHRYSSWMRRSMHPATTVMSTHTTVVNTHTRTNQSLSSSHLRRV